MYRHDYSTHTKADRAAPHVSVYGDRFDADVKGYLHVCVCKIIIIIFARVFLSRLNVRAHETFNPLRLVVAII